MGKDVQFCNILNTLQLLINIVLPRINKVICDKYISVVVPGSEFRIVDSHRSYVQSIMRSVTGSTRSEKLKTNLQHRNDKHR